MSTQPRLSSVALWRDLERRCLKLLREALSTLVDEPTDEKETDLNRSLFRAIIRASHEAARRGEHIPMVVPEGRNPPDLSDLERAEREFKIPDFYWGYIDPFAADPNEAAKCFVVECKRLTEPRARYTQEYVKSGIVRFINVSHSYGKGAASGAMVGYLQGIYLDDALDRVNLAAKNNTIPLLALRERDGEAGAELRHELYRSFQVSPFQLTHMWSRIGPEPNP